MQTNYLDFDEYRKECDQLGEREAEAQERLAGFLHSLGIVLNYRDDPRLTDTHVLNPVWVTSGIYTVLNSHKLAKHDGQISVSELGGILDKQTYPIKMHGFLLDLMRKFGFAFGDDQAGRYLIPELLDKQQPAKTAEFVPERMPQLPVPLPPLPGAAGGADPALHRAHPCHEHGTAALALGRDPVVRELSGAGQG